MNLWIVNHYSVPPSYGGGMVRHYYFAKYLEKKGHTVKIITAGRFHNMDVNMIDDSKLYEEKAVDGIKYVFVKSSGYNGNGIKRILNLAGFPFAVKRTLKALLKQEKPDIIYASSPDIFVPFFAMKFGKKYNIPVIFEVRDLWPESIVVYNHMSKHNPIIVTLYAMEKWLYKNATKIIFTMPGGLDYVRDRCWEKTIDFSKIYNVNNGVDVEVYVYNKDNYHLKDPFLLDEEAFNIVYTGSIRKANGLEYLIDVACYLKKAGCDDIKFILYGTGNDKDRLEEYCKNNDINNVYFRGKVDNKFIPYILSKSKVNYMHGITTPLMKYGCSPNKLFDYIASGRPILSDLDTPYDIVERNQLGRTVRSPKTQSIAEAIIEMKDNYKTFEENAKANYKKVLKQYDYQFLTEQIERILDI